MSDESRYFTRESRDGVLILTLTSNVDVLSFSAAMGELRDELTGKSGLRVLLNCSKVERLQSVGIGKLVSLNRHVFDDGSSLRLCELQPHVLRTLKAVRMDVILDWYETEQEALADWPSDKLAEENIVSAPRVDEPVNTPAPPPTTKVPLRVDAPQPSLTEGVSTAASGITRTQVTAVAVVAIVIAVFTLWPVPTETDSEFPTVIFSGTLTLNGKLMPEGTMTLTTLAAGPLASIQVPVENGSFVSNSLPAGPYAVWITTPNSEFQPLEVRPIQSTEEGTLEESTNIRMLNRRQPNCTVLSAMQRRLKV